MPWERGRDEFLLSWVQSQGKGRWRWRYHSPASYDGEAEGGETTSLGELQGVELEEYAVKGRRGIEDLQ